MTRVLRAIVYNWPLKVMAIALATLLYAALVIAQNAQNRDLTGVLIHPVNQQASTILIGDLGEVTNVQYLVADPTSVSINSANFTASVDLSQVQPGPQAQSVRVSVQSADTRVQVLSATPAFVLVRLEKVAFRDVPVVVLPGPVPEALEVDAPKPSFEKAKVRGAQSDVDRVVAVRAVIPVDPSGIDIDRDFVLVPVDVLDEKVAGVDVDPALVHVSMAVRGNETTKTVPIVPATTGSPAAGFEVVRVTVSVPLVTLQGDAENLDDVVNAQTDPASIDGRTTDLDVAVGFDLPAELEAVNPVTVRVHVTIRAVTETRTVNAGVVLSGVRNDRTYDLSSPQALVTIGGSPVDLDRLNAAALDVSADVSGLDVGVHEVRLTLTVQAGLTVVAIAPATITITIGEAATPASPSAGG